MFCTATNSYKLSELVFKILENRVFKEEIVTKVGLYDIDKSTTLESNKSLTGRNLSCTAQVMVVG